MVLINKTCWCPEFMAICVSGYPQVSSKLDGSKGVKCRDWSELQGGSCVRTLLDSAELADMEGQSNFRKSAVARMG